jgi:glycosyltransferase involved in cell wall biosynthesis
VLVGEGPQGDVWRRAAGPGVHFAGAAADVAPWLRAADAFVLPSETEGLSNALLEAMATGLPVVATRVGGARDVVEDGRSGRLVPVADEAALARALSDVLDPARAVESAALGRAARGVMVEHHALDAVAGRLTALYDGLVHAARPAPGAASRLAPSGRGEGVGR